MNLRKYLGKRAYINKEGVLFGKPVTITQIMDENTVLVTCDWFDKKKTTLVNAQYLTIELPANK